MGMLPAWLRLGETEIANRARTLAYIRNGLALSSGLRAGQSADCDCDPAVSAPYVSPAADDAPWYVAARPESGQFLGLSLDDIDLSGPWTRAVSPRGRVGCNGGGSSVGPLTLGGRTVSVSGLLVAATQEAMDYGVRWLSEALRGTSQTSGNLCGLDDLCFATSCNGSDITYRTIRKAGVIDGPLVATIDGVPCAKLRRVSFTLASEIGYLFEDEALCLNAATLVAGVPLCCRIATDAWIGDATTRLVIASGAPAKVDSIRVRTRPFRAEYALDLPGTAGNYASTPDAHPLDLHPLALRLPGTAGNYVSAPDIADLGAGLTQLDVRVKLSLDNWDTAGVNQAMLTQWNDSGNQRAFLLRMESTNRLRLRISTTGADSLSYEASVATGFAAGSAHWIRATWDDATDTVKFYTSDDYDPTTGSGTWVQLGADSVVVTPGPMFNSTAPVRVGAFSTGTVDLMTGIVHYAEIRTAINGTVVASPNFDQPAGTTSFTDSTGKVWTINGSGSFWVSVADVDLRAKVSADDWTPTTVLRIVSKRLAATQISYDLGLAAANLALSWSANGTTTITKTSTVAPGLTDGTTKWVRATLDVDNGAGGNDVKFYMSDDGITWVQLGTTVTTAVPTMVFAGTAPLEIGELSTLGRPWAGNIYYAEVRTGIDGTVVASPDFNQKPGTTTFTDKQGNVWTVNGSGSAFVGTNGCPGATPVCSDFTITSMPPGTEMVIDGTDRTIQLERVSSREVLGGVDLVTVADGGPFEWIDLGACTEVCVCVEAAAPNANTTVTLGKIGRET